MIWRKVSPLSSTWAHMFCPLSRPASALPVLEMSTRRRLNVLTDVYGHGVRPPRPHEPSLRSRVYHDVAVAKYMANVLGIKYVNEGEVLPVRLRSSRPAARRSLSPGSRAQQPPPQLRTISATPASHSSSRPEELPGGPSQAISPAPPSLQRPTSSRPQSARPTSAPPGARPLLPAEPAQAPLPLVAVDEAYGERPTVNLQEKTFIACCTETYFSSALFL